MKKATLIDYFRDYNEETVLQAIAYYNRNHDLESENRYKFDWELFGNILSNIEDGCLIVTEDDMEDIDDDYYEDEDESTDYDDDWDSDVYPDYYDEDEDCYDDDSPGFVKCPGISCRECGRCYED